MTPPFLEKNNKHKSGSRSGSRSQLKSVTKSNSPRKRISADTSAPTPSKSLIRRLTQFITLILLLSLGIGTLLYIKRDQWGISAYLKNYLSQEIQPKPGPKPIPDPEKYAALTAQIIAERDKLKTRYLNAATRAEQTQIIDEASVLLENTLPEMMRCWLGHPWDFHGTATTPGEGKIACGYFITVIMRDAGFNINRIKVAQQPSQNIIRTFVNDRSAFEVKTNTPYQDYVNHITKNYEGIHIVGLDKHVAFIVIKDQEMRFIHSGGLQYCVVDEDKTNAHALEHSNYRVISNISRNPQVLKMWILNEGFPTVGQ
jgi:hypothetical protein